MQLPLEVSAGTQGLLYPKVNRLFKIRRSPLRMLILMFALGTLAGVVSPQGAQAGQAEECTFSTLAGPPQDPGAIDGAGSDARFNAPQGVAVDGAGNIYVADTGNSTIRKVTPDGVVTTLAGSPGVTGSADGTGNAARFNAPQGVAVDGAGNVYVADTYNATIRKVTPDGVVTTLAGLAGIAGNADGTGNEARFIAPNAVAVDAVGNVYVADESTLAIQNGFDLQLMSWGDGSEVPNMGTNLVVVGTDNNDLLHIRIFDAAGNRTTDSDETQLPDQAADIATLKQELPILLPPHLLTDLEKTQVIEEVISILGRTLRKVTPAGVVTTIVAGLADPRGIAVDSAGDLYVADGNMIRKVLPSGELITLAGQAGYGSADGTGGSAQFNLPKGVAVDSAGNVYVGDCNNCTIRKVTAGGVVTTLAGLAVNAGSDDGSGSAARFAYPKGVAVDSAGNVYVADLRNCTIRKVTPDGVVTTLAGLAALPGSVDGTGSAARFKAPHGVAADRAGNVYVVDQSTSMIRKVTADGVVTTMAGGFRNPQDLALDGAGNIYVADTGNDTIRKVTPEGVVTTLAGLAGNGGSVDGQGSAARFNTPYGVAVDNAGNVYVADTWNYTIRKVTPDGVVSTLAGMAGSTGNADGIGSAARFNFPSGLAVDGAGNIYVADRGGSTIRKVTPDGAVTTLAGLAGNNGGSDGTGSAARFYWPQDVAVDPVGNVYVADSYNDTIRKVTPAGVVTTLAGLAGSAGTTDGTGSSVRFNAPGGVVVNAGHVYVADTGNSTIRVGVLTCPDQPQVIPYAGGLGAVPVGLTRQLDTSPQTAVAWQWSLVQRPAGSTASLSDPTVRNPTFTPDVPDTYIFQLNATNADGAFCVRTVDLTVLPGGAPVLSPPTMEANGSAQLNLVGLSHQTYKVQVSSNLSTWTDWTNVTSTSSITPLTDPASGADKRFYRASKN